MYGLKSYAGKIWWNFIVLLQNFIFFLVITFGTYVCDFAWLLRFKKSNCVVGILAKLSQTSSQFFRNHSIDILICPALVIPANQYNNKQLRRICTTTAIARYTHWNLSICWSKSTQKSQVTILLLHHNCKFGTRHISFELLCINVRCIHPHIVCVHNKLEFLFIHTKKNGVGESICQTRCLCICN